MSGFRRYRRDPLLPWRCCTGGMRAEDCPSRMSGADGLSWGDSVPPQGSCSHLGDSRNRRTFRAQARGAWHGAAALLLALPNHLVRCRPGCAGSAPSILQRSTSGLPAPGYCGAFGPCAVARRVSSGASPMRRRADQIRAGRPGPT